MACRCIEATDSALAYRNTRMVVMLSLRGKPPQAVVATEVVEKRRGVRAVTLIASYCPFCGVAYEVAPPPAGEEPDMDDPEQYGINDDPAYIAPLEPAPPAGEAT